MVCIAMNCKDSRCNLCASYIQDVQVANCLTVIATAMYIKGILLYYRNFALLKKS